MAAVTKSAKQGVIDFTQVLIDPLSGAPILIPGPGEGGKPIALTLGRAAAQALFFEEPDSRATGEDRFRRGALAYRIKDDASAVLTVEEVALVKKQIGRAFLAGVVHAAWTILDPAHKA